MSRAPEALPMTHFPASPRAPEPFSPSYRPASPGMNGPMPTNHLPASPGPPPPGQTILPAEIDEDLRVASSRGQLELVGELLAAGAMLEPDKDGRTALHYAAQEGHVDTCLYLINRGCGLDIKDVMGYSPLLRAASQGARDVVQVLLEAGCDANIQDEHGNAALHEACWNGFSKAAELLVHHNCNVVLTNKAGFTALHLAAQNGHNESSRVLLYAGCNPDIKNNYGDTALHTAARYGHAGVARILISARCKLSEQNKNGDSALHIAAALKRRKIAKILVESGTEVSLVNKQSETAMDVAKRKEHPEIMVIIETCAKPRPQSSHTHHPAVTFKDEIEMVDGPIVSADDQTPVKRQQSPNTRPEKEKKAGFFFSFKRKKKDKDKDKDKEKSSATSTPTSPTKQKQTPAATTPGAATVPGKSVPGETTTPSAGSKDAVHGFFSRYVPREGLQLYRDLAGNIKQGPIGYAPVCQCGPSMRHLESALTSTKQNLHQRIDASHHLLSRRIDDLDQRTRPLLYHDLGRRGGGGGYATDTALLHHRHHRDGLYNHHHLHSHHGHHQLHGQQHHGHHHHHHHHGHHENDAVVDSDLDDDDDYSYDGRDDEFDDENSLDIGMGSRDGGGAREEFIDGPIPEDLDNWFSDKLASFGHCLNHHHDDSALPPRNLFADFHMGRLVRSRSDETLSASDYSGKFRKRDFYASRQAAMQQIRGWELPQRVNDGGGAGRTSRKDRSSAQKQQQQQHQHSANNSSRSKNSTAHHRDVSNERRLDVGGKKIMTHVQIHHSEELAQSVHRESNYQLQPDQVPNHPSTPGRAGDTGNSVLSPSTNSTTSPGTLASGSMLARERHSGGVAISPSKTYSREVSSAEIVESVQGSYPSQQTVLPPNHLHRQQQQQQQQQQKREEPYNHAPIPPYPQPPKYNHQPHQYHQADSIASHSRSFSPDQRPQVFPSKPAPNTGLPRFQDNYGIHYSRSRTLSTDVLNEDNSGGIEGTPHQHQSMPRSRSADNTLEENKPKSQWASPYSSGYATDTANGPGVSNKSGPVVSPRNIGREGQSLSPTPRATTRYRLAETSSAEDSSSSPRWQKDPRYMPQHSINGNLATGYKSSRVGESPRQTNSPASFNRFLSKPSQERVGSLDKAYDSDKPSDISTQSPQPSPGVSPGLNPLRECLQHDSSLLSPRLPSTVSSPGGITNLSTKEDSTCSSNQDSGIGQERRYQERRTGGGDASFGTPSSSFSMERSNTPSTTGSPYASQRGTTGGPLLPNGSLHSRNFQQPRSHNYSPLAGPNGSFRSSSSESHHPDDFFSGSGKGMPSKNMLASHRRFSSSTAHISSSNDPASTIAHNNNQYQSSNLSNVKMDNSINHIHPSHASNHSQQSDNSFNSRGSQQYENGYKLDQSVASQAAQQNRHPMSQRDNPVSSETRGYSSNDSSSFQKRPAPPRTGPTPPPKPVLPKPYSNNSVNIQQNRISSNETSTPSIPHNPVHHAAPTHTQTKPPNTPTKNHTSYPEPPRQKVPPPPPPRPITQSKVQAHVQGWYQKKLLEAAERLRQSDNYADVSNFANSSDRRQSVELSSAESHSGGDARHSGGTGPSVNGFGGRSTNFFGSHNGYSSSSPSPSPQTHNTVYSSNRHFQYPAQQNGPASSQQHPPQQHYYRTHHPQQQQQHQYQQQFSNHPHTNGRAITESYTHANGSNSFNGSNSDNKYNINSSPYQQSQTTYNHHYHHMPQNNSTQPHAHPPNSFSQYTSKAPPPPPYKPKGSSVPSTNGYDYHGDFTQSGPKQDPMQGFTAYPDLKNNNNNNHNAQLMQQSAYNGYTTRYDGGPLRYDPIHGSDV